MSSKPQPPFSNVVLSSAYLMPVGGKLITAHQTRRKVMDLLEETMERRRSSSAGPPSSLSRAMIVDISATTWNWDTYAIVAGKPSPVELVLESRERLLELVSLDENNDTVQAGILVPQPGDDKMVWVPKGAVLRETNQVDNNDDNNDDDATAATTSTSYRFVFEAPVDPNDDRLEHWEQKVKQRHLYEWRAQLARDSMRSMLQYYELDRIVCWDLSWGIWEAVRVDNGDDFQMALVVPGGDTTVPFPSDDDSIQILYDCARPVSPELLEETLRSVAGYYLVGGNTYTMSLFHHMWDQQGQSATKSPENEEKDAGNGHMQSLRSKLADGTLFYMGHSAGLIMSGPNILTATFKGIDAFSVVTQPYNAPFVRLPPSETPDSFFARPPNHLGRARTKMLQLMRRYDAWKGYRVVEALAFPHYDARPRTASFPQSAETYLRATDDEGRFAQTEGTLLVESEDNSEEVVPARARVEPEDLTRLRLATNARRWPCYPVANGHAMVLACGGNEVVETLSPEEEGQGILHWDTYMPYVPLDDDVDQFAPGRSAYTPGSFTGDADTLAGDRSSDDKNGYRGDRIFGRLEALGLPNPNRNDEGKAGRLFRSE